MVFRLRIWLITICGVAPAIVGNDQSASCWNRQPKTFAAPSAGQDHAQWLNGLLTWRTEVSATGYDARAFAEPSLAWTRTSYIQPQIHVYDRLLFDGTWTVDRYLDDLDDRYGGIDSVLLWPTYTNIGIDNRNQFDYYRAIPGGVESLRNVTSAFHRRGVRVLLGYNPWDQATRNEGPHWITLTKLLKQIGADGFNGDTMEDIPEQFWQAGIDLGYPIAAEPEGGGYPCPNASWKAASWTPLGWGYFGSSTADNMTMAYDFAPGIDKMKWLDPQGRHLTHVCDRWSKNRTAAIQLAFFNGVGYEPWENIWGLYNALTDRDAELLRRSATILRWAGGFNMTQGFDAWVPHAPEIAQESAGGGVFASRFEKGHRILWLLVNKLESDAPVTINLPTSLMKGLTLFDLVEGKMVSPISKRTVHILVQGLGIGAVLAAHPDAAGLQNLLLRMQNMSAKPLSTFSPAWKFLQQDMHPMTTVHPFTAAKAHSGMILLPRATFHFVSSGVELEGGCDSTADPQGVCCKFNTACSSPDGSNECSCGILQGEYFGVDVQFPWETRPDRNHVRDLDLGPLLIDRDLVTNEDFYNYLNKSRYEPLERFNFLKHWEANRPRAGDERKPVVNIGLEEARAYCEFFGKRLPHSYEWQYAAQGNDGRLYPWGSEWDPDAVPPGGHDPFEIGQHALGNSPFGVRDLVGNVWQYTDSFSDTHTRSVLLRGSSRYRPQVSNQFPATPQYSNWYFPQALELTKHGKYFLMGNTYERAGTLGFRCAADVEGGASGPYHYRSHEQLDQESILFF